MRHVISAAAVALSASLGTGAVQAASIDFTDGLFVAVTANSVGAATVIEEVAGGVTFRISVFTNNLAQTVKPTSAGLDFGIPGVGMLGFTLTADADVTLTSISGLSDSAGAGRDFEIEYSAPGYGPFGIGWATVSSTVGLFGGGFDLAAGEVFTVDHSPFIGVLTQGNISAIGFDTISAPIPLPAGLPLILAGLGALGLLHKRRSA